jgi:3-hydroxy-9,10-secoandrosta-1,3,5(10)-triene-9,17-dione monooxygenase
VPGGYNIKGVWDYTSGCDIATHFLGGVMVIDPETKAPGSWGFILCDQKDVRIVRNWDVIGMQGTGSHRIAIDALTLPEERLLKMSDLKFQQFSPQPGRSLFRNPLYHGPWINLLVCEMISVAVGTARGALDLYEQDLREKKLALPPFLPRFETPDFQHLFGHVQGLVDSAEAIALHLGERYMEFGRRAVDGEKVSPEEERRFNRIAQLCVQLAGEAVDTMFQSSLTSAARKSSPMGRYFRNMAVIRTHGVAQMHQTSTNAARLRFGLTPFSPF